ncbi:MAG: cellulase family glycosylhydrolase [Oscillospiraceae bacterium]|nr:cellulase family glycosylhydrolase [Oscillospiraceae bacterium]
MKILKRLTAALVSVSLAASSVLSLNVSAAAEKYSVARKSFTTNSAIEFVEDMGVGWNLGNAFDASNCTWLSDEMKYESAWNGAMTTKELISAVVDKGFNTIRIPVSWHNHVDENYKISSQWMDRVKEVVDWCIDEGVYVILNVHHDVEEGYYYPSDDEYETSAKYMKTVWTQIAKEFSSYGDKLIFESINEPRPVGTNNEWWYQSSNPGETALEAFDNINKLNQIFVDTVRAQGGNNKTRYLMIQGYAGSTEGLVDEYFTMPEGTASNKIIVSSHIYSVKSSEYTAKLDKLFDTFISNGIPVVVGEIGSTPSDSSRAEAAGKTVAEARARGITCIWWDNNSFTSQSDGYGLIDRASCTWKLEDIADALVANASASKSSSSTSKKTSTSTSTTSTTSNSSSSDSKSTTKTSTSTSTTSSSSGLKTPTVKATAGDKRVTLSWNSVDDADYYKLYMYNASTGKYKYIGKTSKTKCAVSGLTNGKTYKFLVKACSNDGDMSSYGKASGKPTAD